MAFSIFYMILGGIRTTTAIFISGTIIFRRRTSGQTAYRYTTPLCADNRLTGTMIMKYVDERIKNIPFSEFNIHMSPDFLFSRDPVFISPLNDFFLPFDSHSRDTATKCNSSWMYDPSENTILKEYVDMNFTRHLLRISLINKVPFGDIREWKDLIHHSQDHSHDYTGMEMSAARLSTQI